MQTLYPLPHTFQTRCHGSRRERRHPDQFALADDHYLCQRNHIPLRAASPPLIFAIRVCCRGPCLTLGAIAGNTTGVVSGKHRRLVWLPSPSSWAGWPRNLVEQERAWSF